MSLAWEPVSFGEMNSGHVSAPRMVVRPLGKGQWLLHSLLTPESSVAKPNWGVAAQALAKKI
jgi:hypothetical protein